MILLAAATPWESRPIAKALGLKRDPRTPYIFFGRHADAEIFLLETGIGARSVESTLARFRTERPRTRLCAIISTGFAGGLQPDIRSGDIITDFRGAPHFLLERARDSADAVDATLHMGKILSTDKVLALPEEKRILGQKNRAAAVDMESGALRIWAANNGAHFLGARAVFDEMDQRLPSDPPASASFADGLRYALKHWREARLLFSLAIQQKRAIRALSLFLKNFLDASIGELHEDKSSQSLH